MLDCWEGTEAAKRYVLLEADGDLSEADVKELQAVIEERYGRVKLIQVAGNPRAVIVKTTGEVASQLREPENRLGVGGKTLESVLTSGAVGKLKSRASRGTIHGQVHE